MEKKELIKRFKEFCSSLSKQDKVAIIHHTDADGICSAVITAKAIERITGNKPVVIAPYEYGNNEQAKNAVKLIKKKKANTLIIVDIGIDSTSNGLGEKCPFEKGLVIDHHKMYRDMNGKNLVFLKAQFFTKKDPSGYVTSKFAFDLFGKVVDVKDLDWLACIGILGDMSLERWQKFMKKTIVKRHFSLTFLYKFLDLIASVEVMASGKIPELFWEFYNAKSPKHVLEGKFGKHLHKFLTERDLLVDAFKEKAEFFPKIELYFYDIKSKHENIKSYVINQISEINPDKTVILIQYLQKGRVRFSARRQDFKVAVNDLLVAATKDIPDATAGGHVPAAAGSIPRAYLAKFKKNVASILEKKYEKKALA